MHREFDQFLPEALLPLKDLALERWPSGRLAGALYCLVGSFGALPGNTDSD